LNYAPVAEIQKGNDGRVNGVQFTDLESGEKFNVGAKVVINATGAFCSAIQAMADPDTRPVITFSRGVHLVFDRCFMPSETALLIPKTTDGRVLFCIPWNDRLLVGTTDTAVDEAELEPRASESEIEFILEMAAPYLAARPARSDVLSVFAGIRPLVKTQRAKRTSSLSRSHELFVAPSGLVTITGGKWTTYRKMAEDAVDIAAGIGGLEASKCVTPDLSIEPPILADDDERLHSALDLTRSVVLRAVRDEMALTVEDVLARRTRALFLDARIAIEMAPEVAAIMADERGRNAAWVYRSVEDFRTIAAAYRVA
jgi:glycerol-3-phosphate dehydrogenase